MKRLVRHGILSALALTLGVATAASPAAAQSAVKAQSFEFDLNMGGYFFLQTDPGYKDTFTYGLSGAYNFTEHFGVQLAFHAAPREVNAVSVFHLSLDFLVHPIQHEWFVPFIGVGPTFAFVVPDGNSGSKDTDPGLNVLAGIDFYPWEDVGIRIQTRYIPRFGVDAEKTEHDLLASFGVFIALGGDSEPEEPIVLDTDGDGLLDPDDACPTVPGPRSADGCPDADGDTITDDKDACPKVAGPIEYAGCPDSDGDKIVDKDDRCVKVPGLAKHKGCPDVDGDDIPDIDDRCPKIKGEAAYQGCPPPPPEEVVKKFSGAIKGIYFKVNSDEIREKSFVILDDAVRVMKEFPQLRIKVEGHTSSEGGLDHNMDLSQRRAASVRRYLVEHGIDAGRLESEGFGPKFPVATNHRESGRKKNRRIEFKILKK